MEDENIVDLFLKRNVTAISKTSEKYGKKLRALAYNICGDMTDAEECENDTYLKAWESIPPHEPRTYLFSFLSKIARCTAINCVKRETRQKRSAAVIELSRELENSIPCLNDVEAQFDAEQLNRSVSEFLRGLSDEKRNIFLRRYWYMDTISDISRRYSISEGKVKSVLFRTRKVLYEYLLKEGLI